MSDIVIKKVINYDVSKLEKIVESTSNTLRKTYKPKGEVFGNKPSDFNEDEFVVAEAGEEIIGSVRIKRVDDRLHLIALGIIEEFRNKGICYSIIRYVLNIAKEDDLRCLSLYTIRETGNVEIFEKMGFSVVFEEITHDFTSDIYQDLHEVYLEYKI